MIILMTTWENKRECSYILDRPGTGSREPVLIVMGAARKTSEGLAAVRQISGSMHSIREDLLR